MLWRAIGAMLVFAAVELPAALSGSCPGAEILTADCSSARRSSVGNCLVCMSQKHGTACTARDVDAFCSGSPDDSAAIGAAPCDSAPCQNGGTCRTCVNDDSTAGQDGHSTCSSWYDDHPVDCGHFDDEDFAANQQCCACGGGEREASCTERMVASTSTINVKCCGSDNSACAAGVPTSCDRGCAAVFLPLWNTCGWVSESAKDQANLAQVAALCHATEWGAHGGSGSSGGTFTCACTSGYTGAQCETVTAARNCDGGALHVGGGCPAFSISGAMNTNPNIPAGADINGVYIQLAAAYNCVSSC